MKTNKRMPNRQDQRDKTRETRPETLDRRRHIIKRNLQNYVWKGRACDKIDKKRDTKSRSDVDDTF